MKLFLRHDIREIDTLTIKEEQISSSELMERAATALADEIMARWNIRTKIVLFAGPGNNGGDALALARILSQNGFSVETFLFNPKQKLSVDCQKNKNLLEKESNCKFSEVTKEFNPPVLRSEEHTSEL